MSEFNDTEMRIARLASVSVARGVGFAALGMSCFMIAFAEQPYNLCRAGGFSALLISLVLLLKALRATGTDYKTTEIWVMLHKSERPPPALAATLVTRERRLALLRWSSRAAWLSALLLGLALLLRAIGF